MPERKREVETPIAAGGAVETTTPVGPAAVSEPVLAKTPVVSLRTMLAIAAPSVVTMLSYSVMQFVDRLLVKEIGPEPIYVAAQGTAGITTWTMMTFCVGLTGVVSSFVSQNLGAGRPERGAAYAWNSMWLALAYWAVIMLPAAVFAPRLFGVYGHPPEELRLEVAYATVSMGGAAFTLMAKGLHNYFFGLHRPVVVAVAVVLGNLVNIYLDFVLIFGPGGLAISPEAWYAPAVRPVVESAAWAAGALGVPAMGIAGAALATVIGTGVEWGVAMVVFLSRGHHRAYGSRRAWRVSGVCLRDLGRVGWPAGLMFVNELVLWSYMMSYLTPKGASLAELAAGGTGEAAKAAGTSATTTGFIALQWMHLSFMPAVGISIATQAMVGKAMGAGSPGAASRTTWLGLRLTVVYMGLCALLFVLFGHELIGVFVNHETPPDEAARIIRLGVQIMIAAAVFQVFDAVAITTSAALRGAGDTVWPGVATIVLSWACIVGVGNALIRVWPEIGAIGAWIGASAYIVLLGVLLMVRFLGGRWRSIRLVHDDVLHNLPPDEVAPGTAGL